MVKVKGEPPAPKRLWFQTHQERLEEKDRFKLSKEGGAAEEQTKTKKKRGDNQKLKRQERKKEQKKAKKKSEMTPEERTRAELNKVMLSKPKSMRSSNDVSDTKSVKAPVAKKSGSAFAEDLTNTSQRSVKRLRYQGNVQSRQLKTKKKGK